jgi:predicted glycoside hydrolase/deacetylase ChbG (UPF0249 family)
VVLVDGEPVLSPTRDVPNLADPINGRLSSSLFGLLYWHFGFDRSSVSTHKVVGREIEAETAAQIALLQKRGLRLTHIDTHKHAHIFPAVLRPVLRAARAAGIHAVRNPFEPAWSLRSTHGVPWLRRAQMRLLRLLEPTFRRIVAEEGFTTTDGAIGILATGTLDAATITSLLRNMPEGTWELVTHPGYNDSDLAQVRTRLRASREIERQALLAISLGNEVELINYSRLSKD